MVELEESVGTPGTTIGTWCSVLPRFFLQFLIRCGFGPLVSTHVNTSDLRRIFPSDGTAGVAWRICTATNKSKSFTFIVASSLVDNRCKGFWILEQRPVPLSSDLPSSACALMLRNLQRILFPPVLLRMVLGHTKLRWVRKNVVLSFSLPRVSTGASLLSLSLFLRPIVKFGAYGLR